MVTAIIITLLVVLSFGTGFLVAIDLMLNDKIKWARTIHWKDEKGDRYE